MLRQHAHGRHEGPNTWAEPGVGLDELATDPGPRYDPFADERATAAIELTQDAVDNLPSPDYCVDKNINVRKGPGTNYEIIAHLSNGDCGNALGRNADGTWILIDAGQWISADVIDLYATNLPIVGMSE